MTRSEKRRAEQDRGRRLGRQWLWLLICAPLWAGPTQGAVGSCSCEDDPLDEPVDVQAYCQEREELVCIRAYELGETTLIQRDDCRREAIEACALRTFPTGCAPTEREARACLNALHARSTLGKSVSALPECRDLCPYEAGEGDPDGVAGAGEGDSDGVAGAVDTDGGTP